MPEVLVEKKYEWQEAVLNCNYSNREIVVACNDQAGILCCSDKDIYVYVYLEAMKKLRAETRHRRKEKNCKKPTSIHLDN